MEGISFAYNWEVSLIEWLQSHMPEGFISVVSHLSIFGEELVAILVLGFLYWCLNKQAGKYVGLNLLAASVYNPMVKNCVLRRRPYFDHETISILRPVDKNADVYDIVAQGYSFPSGHSTTASSLFGSIALYFKKRALTVIACILCLLVGFSRVVVGAHFPTDIICGWLVSAFAIGLISGLRRVIKNENALRLVVLLTALPGLFFCKSADYFTCFGLLLGFIASIPVEERFVQFENTRSPIRIALRLVGGLVIFFAADKLLKLPFDKGFLASGQYAALLVRAVRYTVISFLEFGVYPMIFKYTKNIGPKRDK